MTNSDDLPPERREYAEKRVAKLTTKINQMKAAREKFVKEERWSKQFSIDYNKVMKSSVNSRKRWLKMLGRDI